MSGRRRSLALGLGLVGLLATPVGMTLLAVGGPGTAPFLMSFAAVQLTTTVVGTLVAVRLPGNTVGWILLGMGVGLGLCSTATGYGRLGLVAGHGPLPGDEIAVWFGGWAFIPVVFGGVVALVHLFPDGRFLSRGWRRVGLVSGLVVLGAAATESVQPGPMEDARGVDNPFGASGSWSDLVRLVQDLTDIAALPVFALAAAALVVRFQRSSGVERQQLKWISSSLVLVAICLGLTAGAPGLLGELPFFLALFSLSAMPVATGVAVLRYRLYDIDVVLNRALVYGSLTALLGALYVGSVLLLQVALDPFVQDSSAAIALSTLTVAGLFRPVRGRVQGVVDRRFFRRRYDAGRTLEAFGVQLRHQVALTGIVDDLGTVVSGTVQPRHVSLWLATPGAAR